MLEEANNKPELLRYFGFVNGSRCAMTLDTGAQVSVMSLDYAKKLGLLLVPADGKIQMMDGTLHYVKPQKQRLKRM